jgi:putative protein-disulfide isomerase
MQEQVREKQQKSKSQQKAASDIQMVGQVKIDIYTDPLCCWSWALENHWRKFLETYPEEIHYEYILCGMIPNWNTYNDPLNSVTKPIQMGPVWMHASEVTQVKMKYSLWHEDPPSSSYPACIAVKTVGLQSKAAADVYLFQLRKCMMEEGSNISKRDVLLNIASKLKHDNFDYLRFEKDLEEGKGNDAFRADLQKAKFYDIGRYPTLTMKNAEGKGIMIVGYRPYEALVEAYNQVRLTITDYSLQNDWKK